MKAVGIEPVEALAGIDPFTRVAPATLERLRSETAWRSLVAGEVLVEAGSQGQGVSVVVDGTLGVDVTVEDGTPARIAELSAGSIVGEVAALLGGRRTAAVTAVEPTTVIDLTAAGFELLLAAAPEVGIELTDRATARLREAQLAAHLCRLFGDLPRQVLDEVLQAVDHVQVSGGERLFLEGDAADAAYVVLSGRLRAFRDGEGGPTTLAELGVGELVGELALLDGERRGADVVAVRDSALARLPQEVFDRLVATHPAVMLAITRRLIARTRQPVHARSAPPQHVSIAVVPHSPDVDLRLFTSQLVAALGDGAAHLWSARVDSLLQRPGIAQAEGGGADDARLRHLLHEAEQQHRFVVLEVDRTWTPWSERVCRQADEVLVVARAADEQRAPGVLEAALARSSTAGHTPRRTLVLQHDRDVERASGTAAWLDAREVDRHVHVRDHRRKDVARLARMLAGTTTGLVLSGGGARGAAHLGVLRAMHELGIEVDRYGGSSMGSVMALGGVLEWEPDDLVPEVSRMLTGLLDYTLPVVSLLKGERITRAIAEAADGRDIEDLWTPFFCISTNLTLQTEVVHQRGDLAHALRASVAIPGVLPPVPMGEDLLIDGGSMNNLPVDRMRELDPHGTVIAVDVAPPRGPSARSDFAPVVSGWSQVTGRVVPGRRPVKVPGIVATLLGSTIVSAMRDRNARVRDGLADLYLDLDLRGHGLLDFHDAAAIAASGYDAAYPRLEAWLDAQTGDGDAAVDGP
jgi:predicted acylesterase/phospholipase RssA/CRP-like cAMP-binding protein